MGGDGGVVATNRKYMRGAGTADHTGDHQKGGKQGYNAKEMMTTCALSKESFQNHKNETIVTCQFGSLYLKEAVLQALLRKKQQKQKQHADDEAGDTTTTSHHDELPSHIRKLSDLYEVRFHRDGGATSSKTSTSTSPTCPITGKVLEGKISAIVLVPGNPQTSNVVAESALQQLSSVELEQEYGPIQKRIRLAPSPEQLQALKDAAAAEDMEKQSQNKKSKKRKHKEKDGSKDPKKKGCASAGDKKKQQQQQQQRHSSTSTTSIEDGARHKVASALQSNPVLSSLFVSKSK